MVDDGGGAAGGRRVSRHRHAGTGQARRARGGPIARRIPPPRGCEKWTCCLHTGGEKIREKLMQVFGRSCPIQPLHQKTSPQKRGDLCLPIHSWHPATHTQPCAKSRANTPRSAKSHVSSGIGWGAYVGPWSCGSLALGLSFGLRQAFRLTLAW